MTININNYKTLNRNNKYFDFIESRRIQSYDENEQTHSHHIIPMYVFKETQNLEDLQFMNSPENIIRLSLEDHIMAHQFLLEVYGNKKDQGAIQILSGQLSEGAKTWKKLGAEAVHEIQKQQNKTMWNTDFQKEMARRSMEREDAIQIRSQGGKKGGKMAKLGIAIQAHERYTFSYKGEEKVSVINCQTGTEVLDILKAIHPTPLQRVSQLLNGTKKSLHGWSCKKHPSGPYHSPENLTKLTNQLFK